MYLRDRTIRKIDSYLFIFKITCCKYTVESYKERERIRFKNICGNFPLQPQGTCTLVEWHHWDRDRRTN
jgi:hypothetical protein